MKNKERQKRFSTSTLASALISTLTLVLAFFLTSCAPPERKFPDLVWPAPPDEPRIKFVEVFQTNLDVEDQGSLARVLAGEDVTAILRKPYGVAVDKDGTVYVSDIRAVFVFDRKNKQLRFITGEEGTTSLKLPIGVAVSSTGRVYVSDTKTASIFVFEKSGDRPVLTLGKAGDFEGPSGIALDEKRQRLYMADTRKHNIKAFDARDGKLLLTFGKQGGGDGDFNFPTNVALDREGNLYVVDTNNFRVQVFTPEGKFIRKFGELGDIPGTFSRPKGIALDSEDNVYVVDSAFQNFQIFSKEGRLLLFVGEGGLDYGRFSLPAGIAIDDEDRIYVVDQLNGRVQVFQYMSEKWKKKQAAQPAK